MAQNVPQCLRGRLPGAGGLEPPTSGDSSGSTQTPIGIGGTKRAFAGMYAGPGGGGGGMTTKTPPAKVYLLPKAETSWTKDTGRIPHISALPLYLDKTDPATNQIKQQGIANCYLAATIAAMANTTNGVKAIKEMIASNAGSITTECRSYDSDNVVSGVQKLVSDRWFSVKFARKSIDVSDVLYMDDSDVNPNLKYLTTPDTDRALWGAIIEVAFASLNGGYDAISADNGMTLNQFLPLFSAKTWEILGPKDHAKEIKKACQEAGKHATMIATTQTAKTLMGWHGFAVIGMKGKVVTLYDPHHADTVEIEFGTLLSEIQGAAVSS